jgi:glucuronokinase
MNIDACAYSRAGLLGNPSDGYFGKTISICVRNFSAYVSLFQTPKLIIEPASEDTNVFNNIHELVDSVSLLGYYGGTRLIKAAIKRFDQYCRENGINLKSKNFTVRYHSNIPRQVGLAGSSAIITAAIRALMQFYEVNIPIRILPGVVLSAETDELGIVAGLQDRVVQAYEGCVYMDFNREFMEKNIHGQYERIDPKLLPSLYIAYKTDLGEESGKVHNTVHARFKHGDPLVLETLNRIGELALEGKQALQENDIPKLNQLINENFDLRSKIMPISKLNHELIQTARQCGASAKFTGSGGSIIGIYKDDMMLADLTSELKKINTKVIEPQVI